MRKRTIARECALKILYRIDISKESVDSSIEDFWSRGPRSSDIKNFANALVKGTCEHIAKIDELISRYASNWEINRMAIVDRNIMRMATFELLYRGDIPYRVSINEAVELAKRYGDVDSGKFVNGVLDKIRKEECKTKISTDNVMADDCADFKKENLES